MSRCLGLTETGRHCIRKAVKSGKCVRHSSRKKVEIKVRGESVFCGAPTFYMRPCAARTTHVSGRCYSHRKKDGGKN